MSEIHELCAAARPHRTNGVRMRVLTLSPCVRVGSGHVFSLPESHSIMGKQGIRRLVLGAAMKMEGQDMKVQRAAPGPQKVLEERCTVLVSRLLWRMSNGHHVQKVRVYPGTPPVARKGLQAKARGRPPEVGGGKEKDSSPRPPEEVQPSDALMLASKTHCRLLISRTVKRIHFGCFKPQVCGDLL